MKDDGILPVPENLPDIFLHAETQRSRSKKVYNKK
jgi:hypothetical protein